MKINRKEKQYRGSECLNCEHPLDISDKYCSNCGQLNSTKKLTLKDFIEEFFGNFYAYDSRLRNSIVSIFTKPGQLAKEFINGKRQHYANPFRLFLSVLIIFMFISGGNSEIDKNFKEEEETETQKDSIQDKANYSILKINTKKSKIKKFHEDSIYHYSQIKNEPDNLKLKALTFYNYYQKHQEEEAEKCFKKLGYENTFLNRLIYTKVKGYESKNFIYEIARSILQNLPLILFVSMPFLALMFWLVSFRRFSYTDNLVFTYTFYTFILLSLFLTELILFIRVSIYDVLYYILFLLIFPFYFYKSLQTFYNLNRKKTIFKFIFLNILFVPFFIITLLFIFFMGAILF